MAEQPARPFHSFSFTLIEGRKPRTALRMKATDGDMYELHVEKGSAANPTSQFTRMVPLDVAQRFKDALQEIGVFNWEESYDDSSSRGDRRWTVNTVFKEGVFSVASKGSGTVPAGFDQMLEELYRLDFPRPTGGNAAGASTSVSGTGAGAGAGIAGLPQSFADIGNTLGSAGFRGIGSLNIGDLGAYSAANSGNGFAGIDFSKLPGFTGEAGLGNINADEMNKLLADAQRNPEALQQRMREEFRHMSPDEQNRFLDMLASTGMATRAWWERFLRG